LTRREHGKAFFFEKKKQKAFVCAVAGLAGKVCVSTRKSFLVLFLEKGLLAAYEFVGMHLRIMSCSAPWLALHGRAVPRVRQRFLRGKPRNVAMVCRR
jgi:hypothetical protein